MDKFVTVTKRTRSSFESQSLEQPSLGDDNISDIDPNEVEIDESDVVVDPGLRKPIDSFNVNMRDRIQRGYVTKGPCQTKGHTYPKKAYGKDKRSFRDVWYDDFDWLEYSVSNDAAYCFCCFLFKHTFCSPGDEAFTKNGMCYWKDAIKNLRKHVGLVGSAHNKARIDLENFKNKKQSVSYIVKGSNLRR